MLIRQIYGNYIAIGGETLEIYPRWLSLFNWGALNGELMALSDNFGYFLVEEERYLWGRSTAFANNWFNFWIKTHNGKMIWKLCKIRAKKELEEIKLENFLTGAETIENNEFITGWVPNSLESTNLDKFEFQFGETKGAEKIQFNKDKITEDFSSPTINP